jgi:GAF domain-containing protein
MNEKIIIEKNLSEEEIYRSLLSQIESVIDSQVPVISNLANVCAILKDTFDKVSWVGFYFLKNNTLYLGPFQGKLACTSININNGVCGFSVREKQTIIVEDVNQFPGHIACDSNSQSEIVVPLVKDNTIYGVLDIDSYNLSAFNDVDKKYLESLCNSLIQKLSLETIAL